MRVTYSYEVPMGHRLQRHAGKCKWLHGHNYLVDVSLDGLVKESGMVIDFSGLKSCVQAALKPYDHAFVLEDGDPAAASIAIFAQVILIPRPPTAEVLAQRWRQEIAYLLTVTQDLVSIVVHETRDCSAEE